MLLDRRGQQELGLKIVHCFILCLSLIMDCLGEDGRRMDLKKKMYFEGKTESGRRFHKREVCKTRVPRNFKILENIVEIKLLTYVSKIHPLDRLYKK